MFSFHFPSRSQGHTPSCGWKARGRVARKTAIHGPMVKLLPQRLDGSFLEKQTVCKVTTSQKKGGKKNYGNPRMVPKMIFQFNGLNRWIFRFRLSLSWVVFSDSISSIPKGQEKPLESSVWVTEKSLLKTNHLQHLPASRLLPFLAAESICEQRSYPPLWRFAHLQRWCQSPRQARLRCHWWQASLWVCQGGGSFLTSS